MLTHPIAQVAYFVSDAREAAARTHRRFGAGPFFVNERIELAWGEHRGEPCHFVHTSAFGQWGEVMMELVQQDEEGPSPFRDMYAPGEEGIHHVACIVDSLEDSVTHYAQHGFELAARAETRIGGAQFVFVDTTALLGHMIELYEGTEGLLGFYEFVRAASLGWDGQDPVRTLG
jgi:catechol 2,3-dioxygenase-like lactoylglutathione lyase family enzyme